MKPAKDMKQTLRYKNLVTNLKSRRPYEKEAALLKEIANGKQWRMDAVLDAIDTKPYDWNFINVGNVFEQAAMFGRLTTIECLSEKFKLEKTSPSPYIIAALDMAALHGHYKVADYCLSLGANPNYQMSGGKSPRAFPWAVDEGNKRKMDYMIKAGADANYGITFAVISNNKKTVDYLMSKGADLNARLQVYGTPFLTAIRYGHDDMASYLLSRGFDLKNAGDAGEAMHTGVIRNNIKMVGLMLNHGVKPDQRLVDDAKYYKHEQMVALLEKAMTAKSSPTTPPPKP